MKSQPIPNVVAAPVKARANSIYARRPAPSQAQLRTSRDEQMIRALVICDFIVEKTCAEFRVTRRQLLSKPRGIRRTSEARAGAMLLCRDTTDATFEIIGRFFGRHYATIINACDHARSLTEIYPEFALRMAAISRQAERFGKSGEIERGGQS